MPVYPKGPGKWRVRIYVGGKPLDVIHHGTRKEALELEAKRRLEFAAQDPKQVRRAVPSYSVFCLGEYRDFCLDHIKASWWAKQRYCLATLIEHCGNRPLNKIDKAVVNAY